MSNVVLGFNTEMLADYFDERERRRQGMSRYLHEEVAQSLRALSLAIPEEAEETKHYALETMQHLRLMAQDLYPMGIDDLGLEDALNMLWRRLQQGAEIECDVLCLLQHSLEISTQLSIYRLVESVLCQLLEYNYHKAAITLTERKDNAIAITIEVLDSKSPLEEAHILNQHGRLRLASLQANYTLDFNCLDISFAPRGVPLHV